VYQEVEVKRAFVGLPCLRLIVYGVITLWLWFNIVPAHMRLVVNEVVLERLSYTHCSFSPLQFILSHTYLSIGGAVYTSAVDFCSRKDIEIYLVSVVPCIFKYSIKRPTRCTINLIFIALSRRHRSTCFGHCCAHHQEPPPSTFAASCYRMIAGLDVFQAVVGLLVNRPQCETRPTRKSHGNQRLKRQLDGAPDDGHNSVRNMLSGVYATKQ
jgi:hypothetical protein